MKKYKLRELLRLKTGKDYKKLNNGNIPVYSSSGIIAYVNQHLFNKESVLLPRVGTLSNIMYANHNFWASDNMYYAEINTELVYPKYLYFCLKSINLSSKTSGTTQPKMTLDSYYNASIVIPDLVIQKKILILLNSIDNKIIVNSKINDNLAFIQ
ncbi:restriction endonuclease subunit S [Mycoplasmopsis gallinarum]|uniref:restriction endonuclease subunit S n=1 Tax=Mycoplasmopsis gallinarum TaxID=29557 RepID=UPI000484E648|nr:restriction endonuclease subunit S [Mycoplasmopsis gallinarum]